MTKLAEAARKAAAALSALLPTEPPFPLRQTPEFLHGELVQRIAALEEAIADLQKEVAQPGIGHNRPPLEPFSEKDFDELSAIIKGWKALPPKPATSPPDAVNQALKIKSFGERIRDYAAKQGDSFVSKAAEAAGKETGKWVVRGPLLYLIADRIQAVADAAIAWLRSLGMPI